MNRRARGMHAQRTFLLPFNLLEKLPNCGRDQRRSRSDVYRRVVIRQLYNLVNDSLRIGPE